MARLSLSLLGPLQVTLDRQPVTHFVYDKARALLVYLAVEAGQPHSREVLAGLLWPDLPEAAARTNLRQVLTTLRHAIADHAAQPPFLLITRETIQLNPAGDYALDVTAFTTLLAAPQRLLRWHGRYAWACGGKLFASQPACALPASRKESGR